MGSIYNPIGNYVHQVNHRNKDLSITNLQGININKVFMPSVANVRGTDLSKYKVVLGKQFAFNPMHVGRDKVLPVSMHDFEEPIIISPAYVVFEVVNEEKLLPEYLMMWFRRPEFDRNAWFTTDSSVRGGFSWNDFCDMDLPVPLIEKQREIVKEYNIIIDRITLKEQINQKLKETTQTIYKQWFVNFDFPIPVEYAVSIGNINMEGKPYKSSGGEMIFNGEMDHDIPKGWRFLELSSLIDKVIDNRGKTPPLVENGARFLFETFLLNETQVFPLIQSNSKNKYVTDDVYSNWFRSGHPEYLDILMGTVGNGIPSWGLVPKKCDFCIAQNIISLRLKEVISPFYIITFFNTTLFKSQFYGRVKDTAQPSIRVSDIKTIKIMIPENNINKEFHKLALILYEKIEVNIWEISLLHKWRETLIDNIIVAGI